jgi:hypothetical protein
MVEKVEPWAQHCGPTAMIANEASSITIEYSDLPALINTLTKLLREWNDAIPANTNPRGAPTP